MGKRFMINCDGCGSPGPVAFAPAWKGQDIGYKPIVTGSRRHPSGIGERKIYCGPCVQAAIERINEMVDRVKAFRDDFVNYAASDEGAWVREAIAAANNIKPGQTIRANEGRIAVMHQ